MSADYATREQPAPQPSTAPKIIELVLRDSVARANLGANRYSTYLRPENGRDALVDLYQELLDALVYVRQAIYERDGQ